LEKENIEFWKKLFNRQSDIAAKDAAGKRDRMYILQQLL